MQPVLVESQADDEQEQLRQKISGFDHGWAGGEAITTPEAMLATGRALLIAAPGMGKTTLVERLPKLAPGRPCAHRQPERVRTRPRGLPARGSDRAAAPNG